MIELNGFCTDEPLKFDEGMTEEDFRSEVIKCLQNHRDDLDTLFNAFILMAKMAGIDPHELLQAAKLIQRDISTPDWPMNHENRDTLIYNYATQVVDDMDFKDLCVFAVETIEKNMESYSDEEVITEIKDHYPHLLEDWPMTYRRSY